MKVTYSIMPILHSTYIQFPVMHISKYLLFISYYIVPRAPEADPVSVFTLSFAPQRPLMPLLRNSLLYIGILCDIIRTTLNYI